MSDILVIDRKLGEDLEISRPLALMPSFAHPVPWGIRKDQYLQTVRAIVRVDERLASLFAEKLYSRFLPYEKKHLEILYYGFGTGITFLLCDRLLRLNRLAASIPIEGLHVVAPDYIFQLRDATESSDFYSGTIENDALFNQWIISRILATVPVVKLSGQEKLSQDELSHFPAKSPFLTRLRKRVMGGTLTLSKMISTFCLFLGRVVLRFNLFKPKCIATGDIGTLRESFMMAGSFFWPLGPLCYVPLEGPRKNLPDGPISREHIRFFKEDIALIFRDFLKDLGDVSHLPTESFYVLSEIIADLLPNLAVERVKVGCEWAISNLQKNRSDSYFTYGPVGGPIGVLYNLAARHLGKKIIGTQHSAWGGYLAGGALVTELLIRGTDDYITFGWTESELGMASWRNKAMPMPSPLLSAMAQNASQDKFVCNLKVQRKILFCAGFLYRFPMIYNSGLKIDLVDRWVESIESIVAALAARNIQVSIKMYNRSIAKLYDSILERWVKAGANLVEEFYNHDVRVRAVLNSGTFYEQFDAVVWDIPTGGFTEALACGVRTFAFLDEGGIVSTLPESKETLEQLLQSGILFSSADKLCSALESMYSNPFWYRDHMPSIQGFQDKFFRISDSWQESWLALLSSE